MTFVQDRSFWSGKRVFVTGHTGFKGSWLCHWLLQLGADVKGFALTPDPSKVLFDALDLSNRLDHVVGDIRAAEALEKAVVAFKPDIVFHLAAQSLVRLSYEQPLDTWSTNVIGSTNVLRAIERAQSETGMRVSAVFATTDKVYENLEFGEAFAEGDPLGGHDPYSASKAACELLVSSWHKSFWAQQSQIAIATARSGNVIGGGDWSMDRLIPDFVRAASANGIVSIRNPTATRPWLHVLDPLRGYMMLAQALYQDKVPTGAAWNFGPDPANVQSVQAVIESCQRIWPVNVEMDRPADTPHEAQNLTLNSNKVHKALGWHPIWDAQASIEQTLHWYKSFVAGQSGLDLCTHQINHHQVNMEGRGL